MNIERKCYWKDGGMEYLNAESIVEESRNYWNEAPVVHMPRSWTVDRKKPKVVDLFCGMGGLSTGFELAGFDVLAGVDIHQQSIETFKESHKNSAAILGDIDKVLNEGGSPSLRELVEGKGSQFRSLVEVVDFLKGKAKIDALIAGIPCQGFSLNNKKRTENDKRNYLFLHFIKAAEMFRPKYIMIENVPGLRQMGNGSFEAGIKSALKDIGYQTFSNVFNAADFGVPQVRKRLVFIGARDGLPIFFPKGEFGGREKPWVSVWDAISDLPALAPGEGANRYAKSKGLTEYQKTMRGTCKVLYNHVAPYHTKRTIDMIASTKPGAPMYKSFRQRVRLSPGKPSPTIVSGGIRPQFQFGHPTQERGLSVREMCRLQSIPDRIKISGGMVEGRVQVGNVVPPLLAKAFAEAIMAGLGYESPFKFRSHQRPLLEPMMSS